MLSRILILAALTTTASFFCCQGAQRTTIANIEGSAVKVGVDGTIYVLDARLNANPIALTRLCSDAKQTLYTVQICRPRRR